MATNSALTIRVSRDGGSRTIMLVGELDMLAAPELGRTLTDVFSDGAKEVVLDLGEVTFIDSSGIRALLEGERQCESNGCDYLLDPDIPMLVRRLFEVAGLKDHFAIRTPGRAAKTPATPRR